MHHANSAAECCNICQGIASCGAFTYRTDQHACWTKSDPRNPKPNSNAISGSCVKPLKCLGEFAPCAPSSAGQESHCTMGTCGDCKFGQYLCPSDQKTCIDGPEQCVLSNMTRYCFLLFLLPSHSTSNYPCLLMSHQSIKTLIMQKFQTTR